MSISSDWPTGRQDRHAQEAEIAERFQRIRLKGSELGRMAQLVGHLGRNFKPMRGGMAQSVEHIVHIDGVVGSSPTVTTTREA